jgi:hypothetical protein
MPARAAHGTAADGLAVHNWLLAGDPSVRWQVMRDVLDVPAAEWHRERTQVASAGWGASLLACQDPAGTWGSGLYNPKWTSTFYTLLLLRNLGLTGDNEQAAAGAQILAERGIRPDGGLRYNVPPRDLHEPGETCVTGMGLAICAHFGQPSAALSPLTGYILREQMADGGWNCQRGRGATHSSFHTTISVLEGLLEFERHCGPVATALRDARARGHEFLFAHSLYRSHRTGAVAHRSFTTFPFPPQWHYDALRGLDYLRAVGAGRDPRAQPAIDLLLSRRRADGRWNAHAAYRGKAWLEMERAAEPGRWNTLRALRVLRWWDARRH